jgi:hypothetical protein
MEVDSESLVVAVSKKRARVEEGAVVVAKEGKKKKSKQDKVAKIRQHNLDSSKKRYVVVLRKASW